jgi:hypothetical protein
LHAAVECTTGTIAHAGDGRPDAQRDSCDNPGVIRLLAVAFWIVALLWWAALVASAATAISAFGTLPRLLEELGVVVPSLAVLDPSPAASGRFLAGHVAERVFAFTDRVQSWAAPAILIILIGQRLAGWPAKSFANRLRCGLFVVADGCVLYQAQLLAPRMNDELVRYRDAVAIGDATTASAAQEAFDRDHRIADPLLRTTSFLLLGAIVVSAWVGSPRQRPRDDRFGGNAGRNRGCGQERRHADHDCPAA